MDTKNVRLYEYRGLGQIATLLTELFYFIHLKGTLMLMGLFCS